MANNYNAEQFIVLEGLDPVRLRPGMYTETVDPLHITVEVIDNAVDEALAGFATSIDVIVDEDGWIEVRDNGRGIPIDCPPGKLAPAVELAFTTLHAGAKFDKNNESSAYRFSGGLHGVGVAVTNALSKEVEVVTTLQARRGLLSSHRIAFHDGEVKEPLKKIDTKEHRGTSVRFCPNEKYFDSLSLKKSSLIEILRSKAILIPGLKISLSYKSSETLSWCYPNGMNGYLEEKILSEGLALIGTTFTSSFYFKEDKGEISIGEGASWSLGWIEEGNISSESFVNLIPTPSGGTHESGFRAGVFEAVKTFMEHHVLLPAKMKLTQEDVVSSLVFILSAKVLDPQFQGQTKEKLTSRNAYKLLASCIKSALELWLNQNVGIGKAISEKVLENIKQRQQTAAQNTKKRTSGTTTILPGKLSDCENKGEDSELFVVEGDSAGGSAKMARDKRLQAILPLKGKPPNTFEVKREQLLNNNEINAISVALGVPPHSVGEIEQALSNLRYGKIVILADADVDGSHIQVLLLTLFIEHFPGLIVDGRVFVAKPPLYRVDVTEKGQIKKIYCEDELERDAVISRYANRKTTVQRFKGLGEMNYEQLWETTMCPDTRKLLPMSATKEDLPLLKQHFALLMSKSEVGARKKWIESDGWKADIDV